MKRYLPFIIVGFVGLVTVAGGTMLYQAKRPLPLILPSGQIGDAGHMKGPVDAIVTLEEFGDFECPPCGTLSNPLNELERDFRGKVRLVFHEFPLSIHAHSTQAALAAEAAALQGRFWEMHDLLYREQAVWSKAEDAPAVFRAYAGMLGLNPERFKKDVADPETLSKINASQAKGSKLGVVNTPTVFLNGKEVPSAELAPAILRETVTAAVRAKPKS